MIISGGGAGVPAIRAVAAWVGISLIAGCSGGMPQLPAMPAMPSMAAFSALAAEAPEAKDANAEAGKQKAEQKPVDIAELMRPGELGDKSLGKANAPVTIVEYASMSCPNCSRFHAETLPKLKKAYIDKGKVRLVFREFPIGHSAAAAALAIRCAPDKDYFKLVEKFYSTQKDWVAQEVKKDEIYKVVQSSGLKRDKFDACLANQSINDALVWVKQRGRAFGVAGTPTFFVNGKKVAGALSFEEMQPVIEAALAAPQEPQALPSPQAERPQRQTVPQRQNSARAG